MWIIVSLKLEILQFLLCLICQISTAISLPNFQKQFILNFHNSLRIRIVSSYLPESAIGNMQLLYWSRKLEFRSQKTEIDCLNLKAISENAKEAGVKYLILPIHKPTFQPIRFIDKYHESVNSNDLMGNCHSHKCYIIDQMSDPQISLVGCSIRRCFGNLDVLICGYNQKIFDGRVNQLENLGRPCSKCPEGYSLCYADSLCTTEALCSKINSNNQCLSLKKLKSQPNIEFRSAPSCIDKSELCKKWSKLELCQLPTIKSVCSKSCKSCKSDLMLLNYYLNLLRPQQIDRECYDKRKECQIWAKKNYCYIKSVQLNCPKICALCPDPPSQNPIKCYENPSMKNVCQKIFDKNFCYSPDAKEFCPVTCGNTKCGTPIPTTTLKGGCLQPELHKAPCEDFRQSGYCGKFDIDNYCPQTCRLSKCGFSSKFTTVKQITTKKPATDPPECRYFVGECSMRSVQNFCKIMCKTTLTNQITITTMSSTPTISTTKTTDPKECRYFVGSCYLESVRNFCKVMCTTISTNQITSTTMPSTPTISTISTITTITKNPTTTKKPTTTTTQNSSPSSTTQSSSISSTATPLTSMSSTLSTTIIPTDPKECRYFVGSCYLENVRNFCKVMCRSSSTTSTPTSITPSSSTVSTIKSTIHPMCEAVHVPCNYPRFRQICVHRCATTAVTVSTSQSTTTKRPTTTTNRKLISTTSTTSTTSTASPISTTKSSTPKRTSIPSTSSSIEPAKATEPSTCSEMKSLCVNPIIRKYCKITCKITTTPRPSITTAVPSIFTEPTMCPMMPSLCINPKFKTVCWKTCGLISMTATEKTSTTSQKTTTTSATTSTTKTTSATTSTTITSRVSTTTELSMCLSLIQHCDHDYVKKKCRKYCELTQPSNMKKSCTVAKEEPSVCAAMATLCNNIGVKETCPITCAKCASIPAPPSSPPPSSKPFLATDYPGCPSLVVVCYKERIRMICPQTCSNVVVGSG